MSSYSTIRRLHLLIEKLNGSQYWSIDELLEYLGRYDIEVTKRTIKRDFDTLRADYGLDVPYTRARKGYRIEAGTSDNLELIQRFFQSSATVHLLKDLIRDPDHLDSVISYKSEGTENGAAFIKPLLDAINEGSIVSFRHEKLKDDTFSERTAEPYFLKEHKARWYLLAYDLNTNEYRTFGLDRITDLQPTGEKFKKRSFNPRAYFDGTFGVFVSDQPVEDILIEVKGLTGKLMHKVPVHSSQKLISRDGETYVFRLRVKPTVEVRTYILSLGRHARVLRPDTLIKDVKKQLRLSLAVYNGLEEQG